MATILALTSLTLTAGPAQAADDQLTQLNLRRLSIFTNWLQRYNVPGVIGEVGWPGDRSSSEQAQWNALASRWYDRAGQLDLAVAYWGTGASAFLDPLTTGKQLDVVRGQGALQRGMNVSGGEYDGGAYPSAAHIARLDREGISWVRIPFKWERLQPSSQGPLNEGEVAGLRASVNAALDAGMGVELDAHNYGRYYGGAASGAQLADLWVKLAGAFPDNRISYGLMNEPYPPADKDWTNVSQTTVTALRNAGAKNLITVAGKHWSNAHRWSCQHPAPWITDPLNRYRYEAHTYFDANNEGRYSYSSDPNAYSGTEMSYNDTYGQAVQRGGVSAANSCDDNSGSASNSPVRQPGGGVPVVGGSSTPPTTQPPTTQPPTTQSQTTQPPATQATDPGPGSYRVVTRNGDVHAFGGAADLGSAPAGAEIVALANTRDRRGYWLVDRDGRVYAFGNAVHRGDMSGRPLNAPIAGIAVDPNGGGYWLLGTDGGIFSFGVPFYGSTGDLRLNQPVVGMTAAPDGRGYWFVAADGGIFAFGPGAAFRGSTGNLKLAKPVVGMAAAPNGSGYWLVASDGGVFAFGVPFLGSTGDLSLNAPVIGMVVSPRSDGYRFVASDGGVFAFGNAPFAGSLGSNALASPVVGISG